MQFRISHFAFAVLLAACTPATTRPPFSPVPEALHAVMADPDAPGKARVTIEAVFRPAEDPSRTPRDLERAAPPGSPGQLRAEQLLGALKDKLGVTTY
ncbi:MAG: hypothetical protein DMD48_10475 [Gemmatimonadetes bacterium]|nr:MAG: hypothetical protein DMD48_10475 [Gemmatimonadota bacterium]